MSLIEVQELERRVDDVKLQYKINQQHLQDTQSAVNQAALKAQRAANDAKQLEDVSTALLILLIIMTLVWKNLANINNICLVLLPQSTSSSLYSSLLLF